MRRNDVMELSSKEAGDMILRNAEKLAAKVEVMGSQGVPLIQEDIKYLAQLEATLATAHYLKALLDA